MASKACEICKHSVRIEYKYKFYSWETAKKQHALFCIAAPPSSTTNVQFSLKKESVRAGYDKLQLYKRYLEVSGVAPCSLFEKVTQKRKITEYEKRAAKEKKEAAEKKKKMAEEKKEEAAAKKKRIKEQKKVMAEVKEKRNKEKTERAKKKKKLKQQKAYRARKKAEKAAAKAKANEFNRFEVMEIE